MNKTLTFDPSLYVVVPRASAFAMTKAAMGVLSRYIGNPVDELTLGVIDESICAAIAAAPPMPEQPPPKEIIDAALKAMQAGHGTAQYMGYARTLAMWIVRQHPAAGRDTGRKRVPVPRRDSDPVAAVEPQPAVREGGEYWLNILESCAGWLLSRAETSWAKQFGYRALMIGYSEDLSKLRSKLAAAAPVADDARRLDWLDQQRQDEVGRDKHGDPELLAHCWGVHGQCSDIRSAIDAAINAAGGET